MSMILKTNKTGVIMIKLIFGIIIVILFSGVNTIFGQENNISQSVYTITCSIKNSIVWAGRPEKPVALNHLKELSPEELDLIIGEGSENFLTFNDNQTDLPWIILWDEISRQKNTSTNRSVELTSSGSFMNGIKENGIYK
jgi:hypothetical protein